MQFSWHSKSAAFISVVLYVWNYRPTDIEADNALNLHKKHSRGSMSETSLYFSLA